MMYSEILDTIVSSYVQILQNNLVGVYLHGSLAMGCATRESDIDILVVVGKPLSSKVWRKLIDIILKLENTPSKGIEMSVVLEKYCLNPIYPTPFELHYSDCFRDKYQNDKSFFCGRDADADLAVHFKTTKHRGICLYGKNIDDVFSQVNDDIYLKSIFFDINDAKSNIADNPMYHTLNLCRTLAFVCDKSILSKLEGGNWAIDKVDTRFRVLINKATTLYTLKKSDVYFDINLLDEFVDYMYSEINRYINN